MGEIRAAQSNTWTRRRIDELGRLCTKTHNQMIQILQAYNNAQRRINLISFQSIPWNGK